MRIAIVGQLNGVNQRDFIKLLVSADDIELAVINDSINYAPIVGLATEDIYHYSSSWPDSMAAFRYFNPTDRQRFSRILRDIDPDVLLLMGASQLKFLETAVGYSPVILLAQGGETNKAIANIFWSDSRIKPIRYRLFYTPIFKKLMGHIAEVWSGSDAPRHIYTKSGLPPSKLRTFDWGVVDTDLFSPTDNHVSYVDDTSKTVIGSFRRAFGELLLPSYEVFFDAVGELSQERDDFHIVIGGLYADRGEQVKALIHDKLDSYNLHDEVTLVEIVPKESLPRYYSGLDVYFNFSHKGNIQGGVGTASKEAMSCGCAFVTFDCPSKSYLVNHGVNGLEVRYDSAEVRNHLEDLLDDERYRKSLGNKARATIEENFTSEIITRRVIEYCEGVI